MRQAVDTDAPGATRRRALLVVIGVLALVIASFATLDLKLAALLAPGEWARMRAFVAEFFPPTLEPSFVQRTLRATLETLAMSLLGTVLATAAGLCLALPASARGGIGARLLHGTARLLLNALRAVPELVWAVLLLIVAGLGPFPGTLALAVHTTGVLGRLFAESIENAAPGPALALRVRGTGGLKVFLWATLPQVLPQLLSYSLYRWENNIRAAAVLGVVGAGGLGQMLYFHLSLFQMHDACTVLVAMVALVACVDAASYAARRALTR